MSLRYVGGVSLPLGGEIPAGGGFPAGNFLRIHILKKKKNV